MNDDHPHAAAGFLYDAEKGNILLHYRDGLTKDDPPRWGFFTGSCKAGELPVDCFVRVMKEKLSLDILPLDVISLTEYLNEELLTYRHVFYLPRFVPVTDLKLSEGAGLAWVPLDRVFAVDLTEKTRRDIKYFLEKININ